MGYHLIRGINNLMDQRDDVDVVVYYETMHRQTLPHKFATMQVAECWNQLTPVVATSLSTINKLLQFPGPTHKIYYVWDLEWLRNGNRYYNHYRIPFLSPDVTLVARSKDHAALISSTFNVEVEHVIEDCRIDQFLKVIEDERFAKQ